MHVARRKPHRRLYAPRNTPRLATFSVRAALLMVSVLIGTLFVGTGARAEAAPADHYKVSYLVKLAEDDKPEIEMSVSGAPSGTPSGTTTLQFGTMGGPLGGISDLGVIFQVSGVAAEGAEWPHCATYPHQLEFRATDGMRDFDAALAKAGKPAPDKADVLAALKAATGKDHSGFFEFWEGFGITMQPASAVAPLAGAQTPQQPTSQTLPGQASQPGPSEQPGQTGQMPPSSQHDVDARRSWPVVAGLIAIAALAVWAFIAGQNIRGRCGH